MARGQFQTAGFVLAVLGLAACGTVPPTVSGPSLESPDSTVITTAIPTGTPAPSPAKATESLAAFDACGLMTPPEVAEIVGGVPPIARPVPGGGWVAGQCAWSSTTAAFLVSVGTSASIKAVGDPGVTDAKGKLEEFQQRMGPSDAHRLVAGIGDGAIVSEAGMAAYKGNIYIEVLNLRLTEEQMIKIVDLAIGKA